MPKTTCLLYHKAIELIEQDIRSRGKDVTTNWTVDGHRGKRNIIVDSVVAFEQSPSDSVGAFIGNYTHLHFP